MDFWVFPAEPLNPENHYKKVLRKLLCRLRQHWHRTAPACALDWQSFVVFGIARYMLLVHTAGGGGNPTRMFLGGDRWFLINGLLWLATVGTVLATGF